MTDLNHLIAVLKLYTEHNPVTSSSLEQKFEVTGAELRSYIRKLRRAGHPIANSPFGYYYAKSYKEIEPTLQDLESRALSMLETVKKLKSNFSPAEQQQESLF